MFAATSTRTGDQHQGGDCRPDGLGVRGLCKRFGDNIALNGVDLHVPRGQLVGFLGANGAGKTTTMRAVLGLVAVDAGSITWHGQPLREQDRRRIGYMPQERGLYPGMRVHEHIVYIGRLAGLDQRTADRRADFWADRVGLTGRANDLIQDDHSVLDGHAHAHGVRCRTGAHRDC